MTNSIGLSGTTPRCYQADLVRFAKSSFFSPFFPEARPALEELHTRTNEVFVSVRIIRRTQGWTANDLLLCMGLDP